MWRSEIMPIERLRSIISTMCRRDYIITLSNCTKETAHTGPELYFSLRVLLMYGTNCLSQLILDHYHCSYCMFCCMDLSRYLHRPI